MTKEEKEKYIRETFQLLSEALEGGYLDSQALDVCRNALLYRFVIEDNN